MDIDPESPKSFLENLSYMRLESASYATRVGVIFHDVVFLF